MRRSLTLRLAATIGAGALLAACSSGDATEDPTASETTTSASPTETESPSPTETTPSETETEGMTVEEAQEILDTTTAVYNDAVIRMLTEQRIGQEWIQQMKSIYTDPMVEVVQAVWQQAGAREFEGYNTKNPTGLEDTVLEVVNDEDACFVVRIERNFYGLTAEDSDSASPPSDRYFIAFKEASDSERDGGGTGWIRAWDAEFRDETPDDLCTRENEGLG